jgi:Holliday junction DNA helicase RuvA
MIARLAGNLQEKSLERIVVDVQGVGYEVRVSLSTYAALPGQGESVQILIHTHVREDSLTLYGFSTPLERTLFERMISVSGVGPKMALALLSGLSPAELAEAIRSGSTSPLCRVPGVGRKTAERLVVDLKDKLVAISSAADASGEGTGGMGEAKSGKDLITDVYSALVNLGYSAREAERALTEARRIVSPPARSAQGESMTFEGLLREALRSAASIR